jgi:hypothetical protein
MEIGTFGGQPITYEHAQVRIIMRHDDALLSGMRVKVEAKLARAPRTLGGSSLRRPSGSVTGWAGCAAVPVVIHRAEAKSFKDRSAGHAVLGSHAEDPAGELAASG